jgi:hypothetical protein
MASSSVNLCRKTRTVPSLRIEQVCGRSQQHGGAIPHPSLQPSDCSGTTPTVSNHCSRLNVSGQRCKLRHTLVNRSTDSCEVISERRKCFGDGLSALLLPTGAMEVHAYCGNNMRCSSITPMLGTALGLGLGLRTASFAKDSQPNARHRCKDPRCSDPPLIGIVCFIRSKNRVAHHHYCTHHQHAKLVICHVHNRVTG